MHERTRICTCVSLALTLSACLDRNGGMIDTTIIDLTTSDVSTTGPGDTSTTFPEIMTTTVDPASSSSGESTDTGVDTSTSEPIPPSCGDGVLDDDEECDHGPNNADDAACTMACNHATCGDGHVLKDMEACDDGGANGDYGKCAADCGGPGPRCGDGVTQMDEGELCDALQPDSGCLKECTFATSCFQLKESWANEVTDGLYVVHRMSQFLTVWCDMDADGGGYTFLKYAAPEANMYFSAKDAEQICSSQYGMNLLVPRSDAHLTAAAAIAASEVLAPANASDILGDAQAYLGILGIYPVTPGESCLNQPLNSAACPQWTANAGLYWVSDTALDPIQPSTSNCAGCSMAYTWEMANPPTLTSYEAYKANGIGATSTHFMCDVGDKLGP